MTRYIQIIIVLIIMVFMLSSCDYKENTGDLAVYQTKNDDFTLVNERDGFEDKTSYAIACAVGDSVVITYIAYPEESPQDCTWSLTLDESKTNKWLCKQVKDGMAKGKTYIELSTDGNRATITAVEYYRVIIQYATYWKLTAVCEQNASLTATCSIKLG